MTDAAGPAASRASSSNAVLLRGTLTNTKLMGVWRFENEPESSALAFELETTATTSPAVASSAGAATFSGYFVIRSGKKLSNVAETFTWSPRTPQTLEGKGRNRFGEFDIEGTLGSDGESFTGSKRYRSERTGALSATSAPTVRSSTRVREPSHRVRSQAEEDAEALVSPRAPATKPPPRTSPLKPNPPKLPKKRDASSVKPAEEVATTRKKSPKRPKLLLPTTATKTKNTNSSTTKRTPSSPSKLGPRKRLTIPDSPVLSLLAEQRSGLTSAEEEDSMSSATSSSEISSEEEEEEDDDLLRFEHLVDEEKDLLLVSDADASQLLEDFDEAQLPELLALRGMSEEEEASLLHTLPLMTPMKSKRSLGDSLGRREEEEEEEEVEEEVEEEEEEEEEVLRPSEELEEEEEEEAFWDEEDTEEVAWGSETAEQAGMARVPEEPAGAAARAYFDSDLATSQHHRPVWDDPARFSAKRVLARRSVRDFVCTLQRRHFPPFSSGRDRFLGPPTWHPLRRFVAACAPASSIRVPTLKTRRRVLVSSGCEKRGAGETVPAEDPAAVSSDPEADRARREALKAQKKLKKGLEKKKRKLAAKAEKLAATPILKEINIPSVLRSQLLRLESTSRPASVSAPLSLHEKTLKQQSKETAKQDVLERFCAARLEPDGSVYEGEVDAKRLRHGLGALGYANGHLYAGWFRKGFEHGDGELRDASGALIYRGEFENGRISGRGTFYYGDGSVYRGDVREGHRHGKGQFWSADGTVYEGEYVYGARTGMGTYVVASPLTGAVDATYTGEWANDVRHGRGVLKRADGVRAEGAFKDNKLDGRCAVSFPDGSGFEGQFKEGQKEGRGTYVFGANGATYEGRFRGDVIAGTGTLKLVSERSLEIAGKEEAEEEWMMPIDLQGEMRFVHLRAGFAMDGS